jgi:hypothetical protein
MSHAGDWIVVVPSYKRYKELQTKTLATLIRQGVPPACIYVFVANDAELLSYIEVCQASPCYFVVGVPGLVNQRNFISNYFEKGKKIVCLDDDIESIYNVFSSKSCDNKEINLPEFFDKAFETAEKEGVTLWGTYPVDNAYFAYARPTVSTTFSYICGAFYGYINDDPPVIETGDALEDRARSIFYYEKEGKTLRFNHICYKTKYFAPGGMEDPQRKERHSNVADILEAEYPHLVSKRIKKNGYADLYFKRQGRKQDLLSNSIQNSDV